LTKHFHTQYPAGNRGYAKPAKILQRSENPVKRLQTRNFVIRRAFYAARNGNASNVKSNWKRMANGRIVDRIAIGLIIQTGACL
jgi:hypothetical protein